GDAVAISAAITVVAVAALYALLAPQFDGSKSRRAFQLLRRHLVHGNAGVYILAVRLFRMDSGEICRPRTSVIARTIAESSAAIRRQPAEHHAMVAIEREGPRNSWQILRQCGHTGRLPLRRPL